MFIKWTFNCHVSTVKSTQLNTHTNLTPVKTILFDLYGLKQCLHVLFIIRGVLLLQNLIKK
jgi:hypothetical protein